MREEITRLTKRMNRLHLLLRVTVHRLMMERGLYFGQLPILEFAMEHEGCTQNDLAEFMQVTPPSVARSVMRMQRTGLLNVTQDEKNRRKNRIIVTEKGREMALLCGNDIKQIEQQMFAGFAKEEVQRLCGYIERLTANLETDAFKDRSFFSLVAEMKEMQTKEKVKDKP